MKSQSEIIKVLEKKKKEYLGLRDKMIHDKTRSRILSLNSLKAEIGALEWVLEY